ncbi:PEP-CTERM sorting domain-containing protein [Oscillatoria amoena NRMC-F 0135]|nr:PEP-CTERM sorting domain-containing protein [Oscillatoria laete-virens]MDL5046595.1 PEP-CTERM sorting domain-containing protein [Oscillatoria amoena NRMC-F 0135]MDL5053585.1 PEP-CTERM sorting domain-containing protein [Oscillatoria laete-virens NRMC-F 0139]
MKNTTRQLITGFIRSIFLVILSLGMVRPSQAGLEHIHLYFDYTNSGYSSDEIWLSWGQGNSGAGQIYYGVGNTGVVNWSGGNLLSDPISLAQVLAGASGGLPTSGTSGGFFTSNAPSLNLYISYGGTANNNIFLNPNQGLTNSPSFGSIYNNIFPVQTVEISHVANNTYSGGDLTAINVLSVDLELKSYAAGQTNPATFLQRAGLTNSIQNVFNDHLASLVGYTAGDIWNPAVAVDQNGRPLRVIPPNSLPTGEIGTWQSWSNALVSIHASNNTTYVSNFNGFAYYDATSNSTTGFVGLAYSMATTVDANNNIIFTGSVGVMTNGDITQPFVTNFTGLTITNFGGADAASDALQSSTIYNQITTTNTGFGGNWDELLSYISANNIVASGFNTNQGSLQQAFTNAWLIPQQNAVGDYTTALAVGLVNSQVTNQFQYTDQAIGTLSSYEWFYKANPGGTIGMTNVNLFGGLQTDTNNFNPYVQTIVNQSTNTVYSNPYGDRIVGNHVFLSSVSNGSEEVGAWVISLKSPLSGTTPPSWSHPTNILSGVNHTTNGIFYVGDNSTNNLFVVRGVANMSVTNGVGGVSSIIGNQESSSNNLVIISGIEGQSVWSNTQGLIVGSNGAHNSLLISNTGFVYAENLIIGANAATSTNNLVSLNNGQSELIIKNNPTAIVSYIDIRGGQLVQNAGTIKSDAILATNATGAYHLHGGTAIVNVLHIDNGQVFNVGDGTKHTFLNQQLGATNNSPTTTVQIVNSFANGVTVKSNAVFAFSGMITNQISLDNGSTLLGSGTYVGDLSVGEGSTLGAGLYGISIMTISSNLTLAGGGTNLFYINSFSNAVNGANYNSLIAEQTLNITATSGNEFVINVNSLASSNNQPGMATGFNQEENYSFTLINAANITGFNSNAFSVVTSAFSNSFLGYWGVTSSNNQLLLNYFNTHHSAGGQTNSFNSGTTTTNILNIGNVEGLDVMIVSNAANLTITNAPGQTISARLGNQAGSSTNSALVTGANSLWQNDGIVVVGNDGSENTLNVEAGGRFLSGGLRVGAHASSSNNFVNLQGSASQIIVTNAGGTATSDIRRGTFSHNSGTFRTDNLLVTNNAGSFDFNGGTAFVGVANMNNGQSFQVGNGTDTAFFSLAQNGQVNTFANGITVNDNATFSLGGVVTNQITLNSGSTLKGQGTYVGDLTVGNGATLSVGNSPGTLNVTGTVTWASGGSDIWEINSFSGTQGMDPGWDFINIVGELDITATSGDQFFLDITSLTLGNTAGFAAGFNDASDYNFILVQTTLGVTGFAADKFNLSLANFQNPFIGTWSLGVTGNNLMLHYTAVIPEPSTYALLALGAICAGFALRRRRLQKVPADSAD